MTESARQESNARLQRFEDVRELIGDIVDNPTPIVRLDLSVRPESGPVYLKLEWYNPFR